jgi:hypothetical protein
MPYAISCEVSSTYPSLMLFCLISFKIETGATRYSCPCGARVQCWRSLSFEEFEGRYNSPRCFPNNVVACAALIIGNHANPLVYKSSARLVNTCYADTTSRNSYPSSLFLRGIACFSHYDSPHLPSDHRILLQDAPCLDSKLLEAGGLVNFLMTFVDPLRIASRQGF